MEAREYIPQVLNDYNIVSELLSTGVEMDQGRTFAYGEGVFTVNGYPSNRVSATTKRHVNDKGIEFHTANPNEMIKYVGGFNRRIDKRPLNKGSGRYYVDPKDSFAGHAEKQSIHLRCQEGKSTKTTGITRNMCDNCVKFFDRYTSYTNEIHYTAGPEYITIFVPGKTQDSGNSIHFRIFI